jgi:hypothetical protein
MQRAMTNIKAATDYLAASGALPISIIEADGVCTFRLKVDPAAISTHWVREAEAVVVIKSARQLAGKTPDADAAVAALHRAAGDQRITLTPHATAMERAGSVAKRLDDYLGGMRGTGVLREFNCEFKRRRTEAAEGGSGFMTYKNALARLRVTLIPLRMSGGQPAVGQSLFAEIFR